MRQLKTFMRNRKKEMLGCWDCECRTLQCRRHVNENCGCWWPWWPSVIWDWDYSNMQFEVGASYTLWLTVNPANANLGFTSEQWLFNISASYDGSNHYDVYIEPTSAPGWLNTDRLSVFDNSTWNIINTINITARQPVTSISIETSSVSTYQWWTARIPFTYNPNNAYVVLGTDIICDSDDSSVTYINWLNVPQWTWQWEIFAYWSWIWSTQVHIYATSNPSAVYTVDVTVNPVIESITLDASSVNIDLDNSPTVSVWFDYLPISWDISSIQCRPTDWDILIVDSVGKDSDWRWHIILTWKNIWETSAPIQLPNLASYWLDVVVTSVYPDVVAINNIAWQVSVRSWETTTLPFEYLETNARFGSIALGNDFPAAFDLELIKDSDWIWHVEVTWHCPSGYCWGDWNLYLRSWYGYSFYVDVQPSIEEQVLGWFDSTSVFWSLSPEQQEEANEKAREIIEEAWDDIIPFYEAMQEGRTFAAYAEQMWLTPDTSGDCGSSVYTDDEAYIIYIWTAWAVSCEYLALVARRWLTPHSELINKQMISDYLDWVTEEWETCTYQFKDWDWEILKFGSVNVWEVPEAPDDPERSGYIFTWWDPEVQQISEDVIFTAQYTEEPYITPLTLESVDNNNTISFQALNNPDTTIPLDYNINWDWWQPVDWNNPQWTLNSSDKIMFRSRSTETTWFNFMSDDREQTQNYWTLSSDWQWQCSGDVTTLINKNWTDTLTTNNVFALLFWGMPHLLSTPTLPAINLTEWCYAWMFSRCWDLTELPTLPATTLPNRCYSSMFAMCWWIRLSETATWEYQYPFRIPASGEWTSVSGSTRNMFNDTGWTYNPDYASTSINTTYYCANSKFVWSSNYLQALDTENLIVWDPNWPHFQVVCHTDEDWVEIVSSTSEMALYNLWNHGWQWSRWDKWTQRVVNEITKVYNAQQQYGTSYVYMNNSIFNAMADMCEYDPYDMTWDNQYLMAVENVVALWDWTWWHPVPPHIETITLDWQSGTYWKPVTVEQAYSVNVHCTYTPTNTTNFGTVSLDYYSYDEDIASVEFHPQWNWEWYVTFTWLREWRWVAYLELDGERVDSVDITVTPHESSYESYESY